MKDTLTLELTGYEVRGTVRVSLWGGGEGTLEMKPYILEKLTEEDLIKGLNDNGFGVESINGAMCYVNKVYGGSKRYGGGYRVYQGDVEVEGRKIISSDLEGVI